jgi:DNA-binding IclR family transcriptional regulator
MDRYNQLKLQILSCCASGEWFRPLDIARRTNFSPPRSTWTYLKRLSQFGLLERRSWGKGTLQYRISEVGLQRLQWLQCQRD